MLARPVDRAAPVLRVSFTNQPRIVVIYLPPSLASLLFAAEALIEAAPLRHPTSSLILVQTAAGPTPHLLVPPSSWHPGPLVTRKRLRYVPPKSTATLSAHHRPVSRLVSGRDGSPHVEPAALAVHASSPPAEP